MPDDDIERWVWDANAKRYRNARTGRLIPAARIRQMRDQLLESAVVLVQRLADQLHNGRLDVDGWKRAMQQQIKAIFGAQYVFGRGGFKTMQPDDWSELGSMVEQQFGFLDGFAADIAAGKLSRPQIVVRAEMYVGSSVQAHEAGKAAAWNVDLPAQPGDGSSECLSNDRCHWYLRRRKDGKVEATWVANTDRAAQKSAIDKRTCKTCRARAKQWNPLVLTPGERTTAAVPTSSRLRVPSIEPA